MLLASLSASDISIASFADMPGFEDYLTALMDLQQGGVDAVIMDLVVGDYRINSMGAENLKAAFALEDDNYGIGFRKEDYALGMKVQQTLDELLQSINKFYES